MKCLDFLKNVLNKILNFSDFSFLSEHSDLRHIMGAGIAVTRGCAAALSFDFALLLLSMSR